MPHSKIGGSRDMFPKIMWVVFILFYYYYYYFKYKNVHPELPALINSEEYAMKDFTRNITSTNLVISIITYLSCTQLSEILKELSKKFEFR